MQWKQADDFFCFVIKTQFFSSKNLITNSAMFGRTNLSLSGEKWCEFEHGGGLFSDQSNTVGGVTGGILVTDRGLSFSVKSWVNKV